MSTRISKEEKAIIGYVEGNDSTDVDYLYKHDELPLFSLSNTLR
jgi:hypothetical protein